MEFVSHDPIIRRTMDVMINAIIEIDDYDKQLLITSMQLDKVKSKSITFDERVTFAIIPNKETVKEIMENKLWWDTSEYLLIKLSAQYELARFNQKNPQYPVKYLLKNLWTKHEFEEVNFF